jgi:hypothetical protein
MALEHQAELERLYSNVRPGHSELQRHAEVQNKPRMES